MLTAHTLDHYVQCLQELDNYTRVSAVFQDIDELGHHLLLHEKPVRKITAKEAYHITSVLAAARRTLIYDVVMKLLKKRRIVLISPNQQFRH